MRTLADVLTVGARDLRIRIAEILQAVEEGETVRVTRRGRPVAEIRPVRRRRASATLDDVFGMWRDHRETKDVRGWVRGQRERRPRASS